MDDKSTPATAEIYPENDVRNVSETAGLTECCNRALWREFEALEQKLGRVGAYHKLAQRLSVKAGKVPFWSWRYVQGYHHGTIRPGRRFLEAVRSTFSPRQKRTVIRVGQEGWEIVYLKPIRPRKWQMKKNKNLDT